MPVLFYPTIQRWPYGAVDARYTEARAIRAEYQAYWAQEEVEEYADAYEYERGLRRRAQSRSLRAATAGYRHGYRHAANDLLAEAGRQQRHAFSLGLREGRRKAAEEQQRLATVLVEAMRAAMAESRDLRLIVNDQPTPSPSWNEAAMEVFVMLRAVTAMLKRPDQEQARSRHDNQAAADRSQKTANHTHTRSCQQECTGRSGTAAPRQWSVVDVEGVVTEEVIKEEVIKEVVVKEVVVKEEAVKEGANREREQRMAETAVVVCGSYDWRFLEWTTTITVFEVAI
ncbi:MAG: hypothetical protein Q9208_005231 [Pyrenodesmia sp. 3 TL-2023]